MCCLSWRAHGGPWDFLGNSWEQEIQPTSADGWCAMRDDGPSTDPDLSVPLRSLPSPWERHLSLASCDDMKLPTRVGTKVSSTLPRHVSIAAWPWSCDRGYPSGKTLWSWATTAGVSCTTVQKVSCWMLLTFWPYGLWNCLTVSDWPSIILFTAYRMDSIHAGDRRACIEVESHAMPRNVVLCSGESTLFLAFSRSPNSFMWARTASRCRTTNWCDWARIKQSSMQFIMRIS